MAFFNILNIKFVNVVVKVSFHGEVSILDSNGDVLVPCRANTLLSSRH